MNLSSKAFNNILIFSMLFMGFIFMFAGHKLQQPQSSSQLFDSQQQLVSLSIEQFSARKVNQQWQLTSEASDSRINVQQLIQHWVDIVLTRCQQPLVSPSYRVHFELQDDMQEYSLSVHRGHQRPLLNINGQCYQVTNKSLKALIPESLQ